MPKVSKVTTTSVEGGGGGAKSEPTLEDKNKAVETRRKASVVSQKEIASPRGRRASTSQDTKSVASAASGSSAGNAAMSRRGSTGAQAKKAKDPVDGEAITMEDSESESDNDDLEVEVVDKQGKKKKKSQIRYETLLKQAEKDDFTDLDVMDIFGTCWSSERGLPVVYVNCPAMKPLFVDNKEKDKVTFDRVLSYFLLRLEAISEQNYACIFVNGCSIPGVRNRWLRKAYQTMQRKHKKNLKSVWVVHPTGKFKKIALLLGRVIQTKFWRKVKYASSLTELFIKAPIEDVGLTVEMFDNDEEKNAKKLEGTIQVEASRLVGLYGVQLRITSRHKAVMGRAVEVLKELNALPRKSIEESHSVIGLKKIIDTEVPHEEMMERMHKEKQELHQKMPHQIVDFSAADVFQTLREVAAMRRTCNDLINLMRPVISQKEQEEMASPFYGVGSGCVLHSDKAEKLKAGCDVQIHGTNSSKKDKSTVLYLSENNKNIVWGASLKKVTFRIPLENISHVTYGYSSSKWANKKGDIPPEYKCFSIHFRENRNTFKLKTVDFSCDDDASVSLWILGLQECIELADITKEITPGRFLWMRAKFRVKERSTRSRRPIKDILVDAITSTNGYCCHCGTLLMFKRTGKVSTVMCSLCRTVTTFDHSKDGYFFDQTTAQELKNETKSRVAAARKK